MLKPFQIRDLYPSSSQAQEVSTSTGRLSESHQSYDTPSDVYPQSTSQPEGASQPRPHAIVRLSATEYDDLASKYPRARLTYIDDDDGELITVSHTMKLRIPFDSNNFSRSAPPSNFLSAWMNLSTLCPSHLWHGNVQIRH